MTLVFIHGPAAAGKLTIARSLQALTGFRLFHNHLVVDTLLAVFQFGSESFVRLREEMWLGVFEAAAKDDVSLIFTFAPECTVRPEFITATQTVVARHGGQVRFVELVCPQEELERRVENVSRAEFKKLRSVATYRELRRLSKMTFPQLPSSGLTIDTSTQNAETSAARIQTAFQLPSAAEGTPFEPYPKSD